MLSTALLAAALAIGANAHCMSDPQSSNCISPFSPIPAEHHH